MTAPGLSALDRSEIMQIEELLPYLRYGDDGLELDGQPVRQLRENSASVLLYLPDRAVANYRALHTAFARHFDVAVYYALKSCYVGPVVTALRTAGAGVEVMSDLELRLARAYGFTPNEIILNGPARPERLREQAVADGLKVIGVDSFEELDQLAYTAARLGARPRVQVRVNALGTDRRAFFPSGSKLGMDLDRAADLIDAAVRSPHLEVVGLHAHQLQRCGDPDMMYRLALAVAQLHAEYSPRLRPFDRVNLGGGLDARFAMDRRGCKLDDLADAAHAALGELPRPLRLTLEPGRYLVADAAVAITRVLGERRNGRANWVFTDIASNVLIPLPETAYPPLPVSAGGDAPWSVRQIGDATCAPSDLCRDAVLPPVDDGLVLLNVGAYTSVLAELWAFDLPEISVWECGRVRRIFGAEQQAQMFHQFYGVKP